jgi:hypothetical protein
MKRADREAMIARLEHQGYLGKPNMYVAVEREIDRAVATERQRIALEIEEVEALTHQPFCACPPCLRNKNNRRKL